MKPALEGTTIKQVVNVLIAKQPLPADAKLTVRLAKPQGTDTYCWRPQEVVAILDVQSALDSCRLIVLWRVRALLDLAEHSRKLLAELTEPRVVWHRDQGTL